MGNLIGHFKNCWKLPNKMPNKPPCKYSKYFIWKNMLYTLHICISNLQSSWQMHTDGFHSTHIFLCTGVVYFVYTCILHIHTYVICQRYDKRCRIGNLILNNSFFFRIWGQIINNSFKCVVYIAHLSIARVSGEKKFLWPKTRKVVVLLLILCFYTTSPSSLPLWIHGMEVSAKDTNRKIRTIFFMDYCVWILYPNS